MVWKEGTAWHPRAVFLGSSSFSASHSVGPLPEDDSFVAPRALLFQLRGAVYFPGAVPLEKPSASSSCRTARLCPPSLEAFGAEWPDCSIKQDRLNTSGIEHRERCRDDDSTGGGVV